MENREINEADFAHACQLLAAMIASGDYRPNVSDFAKELQRIYAQLQAARTGIEQETG